MKVKILAGINDGELAPFVLVYPEWLPVNRETACSMVNEISDHYCSDSWIIGEAGVNEELNSALSSMDWGKAEVLEYDWDEVDPYHPNEKRHDAFSIWQEFSTQVRAKELEPKICEDDEKAALYAKNLPKKYWTDWTSEELLRHPCWMFYYAKNVCKGRLPELLDNAMMMKSFENSENPWIKRYFGTKRYKVRNKKALASIPWAA